MEGPATPASKLSFPKSLGDFASRRSPAGSPIALAMLAGAEMGGALAMMPCRQKPQGKPPIYLGGGLAELGAEATPAVTYRAMTKEGMVTIRAATSLRTGDGGTWSNLTLTDVPWNVTDFLGAFQGLVAYQPCLENDCILSDPAPSPHVPFLAAWVDQRMGGFPEIWARRFPFKE